MGTIGSAILVIVASSLSDEHGALRVYALTEANVVSSLVSALTGVAVGALARTPLGWRGTRRGGHRAARAVPDVSHRERAPAAPLRGGAAGGRVPVAVLDVLVRPRRVGIVRVLRHLLGGRLPGASGEAAPRRERGLGQHLPGWHAPGPARREPSRAPHLTAAVIEASLAVATTGFVVYWRAATPAFALLGCSSAASGSPASTR